MTLYTLSNLTTDVAVIHGFEAPSDHEALWFSRGLIASVIERDPHACAGSQYRLDVAREDEVLDEATQFGACLVGEIDGHVEQSWKTWRRPSTGPDMNVGDPHDQERDPPMFRRGRGG